MSSFIYNSRAGAFWVAVLGHEAVSVAHNIESFSTISGRPHVVAAQLGIDSKMVPLIRLSSFGIIEYNKASKRDVVIRWIGWPDLPGWIMMVRCLSDALERSGYLKSEVEQMSWPMIASFVDSNTPVLSQIGTRMLDVFELYYDAKSKRHFVVLNGNQKAKNGGFGTIQESEKKFCAFSHAIKTADQCGIGVLQVETKPPQQQMIVEVKDSSWADTPVNQWNCSHLCRYIVDQYAKTYQKQPPFSPMILQKESIITCGVNQLGIFQHEQNSGKRMENYRLYVDWLFGHRKFSVSVGSLVSAKMLQVYVAELARGQSRPSAGVQHLSVNPFNLVR